MSRRARECKPVFQVMYYMESRVVTCGEHGKQGLSHVESGGGGRGGHRTAWPDGSVAPTRRRARARVWGTANDAVLARMARGAAGAGVGPQLWAGARAARAVLYNERTLRARCHH